MEEEKAGAYYDELTRKGEGAARFKQGLGFSSSSSRDPAGDGFPSRGSAVPSPSSFLSGFVRASSPSKAAEFQKQKQLESIHNKLRKKPESEEKRSRVSESRHLRRRSRSGDRRQYHSSSRDRDRDRDRRREGERRWKRRSRSRSRSFSDEDRGRRRVRSRSSSPQRERRSERRGGGGGRGGVDKVRKERNDGVDFSRLIEGYDKMSAADRVKAKMKLQLSETAKKDATIGTGSGWERFEFDKDAPLDNEEVEAAEDDELVVKQMGQSFRFSAVEARNEGKIKAAHDEAMFGAPAFPLSSVADDVEEAENDEKESNESVPASNLISDKVLSKQQGSWRARARKA